MTWIELHVVASNSPILVSVDSICRVGMLVSGTFVRQVDGSTLEVSESYDSVMTTLVNSGEVILKHG